MQLNYITLRIAAVEFFEYNQNEWHNERRRRQRGGGGERKIDRGGGRQMERGGDKIVKCLGYFVLDAEGN